jgi:uncharacterized phage protein (TIGR01671 family)
MQELRRRNMRKIKFRGKCIDNIQDKQKWVYGYYVQMIHDGSLTDYIYNETCGWHEIMSGTQGQHTGFKDKNNVDIYEGDIVECKDWRPSRYRIEFREGGFCMVHGDGEEIPTDVNFMQDSTGFHFEVIGNIYENPELEK